MQCFFCEKSDAKLNCPGCGQVSACSTAELEVHRPPGLNVCLPFRVRQHPDKGRILIATRCIKEGEVVVVDKAEVLIPSSDTICLGCCKSWRNGNHCQTCLLPVCDSSCSLSRWHADLECKYFVGKRLPMNAWSLQIIAMVRLVLISRKSGKMDELMDHNDSR